MTPNILVLANSADRAEHTARYAAMLGAPLHARLALLHLDASAVMLEPELVAAGAEQSARLEAETMQGLRALAGRLPAPTDVLEAVGPMAEAVAAAGRQYHPLLLAMGHHPTHSLLDQLLLTQVQPVLRALSRPLLLVPATGDAARLPRRVLLAVDGEPFSLSAAALALAPLLAGWGATYAVAHILSGPGGAARSSHLALADVRGSGLLPADTPLQFYQEIHASPAAGIRQALADTHADLLVLVARPRSFLGDMFHRSVTAAALRHCPVPVLLLPAAASGPLPAWVPKMH